MPSVLQPDFRLVRVSCMRGAADGGNLHLALDGLDINLASPVALRPSRCAARMVLVHVELCNRPQVIPFQPGTIHLPVSTACPSIAEDNVMATPTRLAIPTRLHEIASRKLDCELKRHDHHLSQLLGHVAVLESVDARLQRAADLTQKSERDIALPPAPSAPAQTVQVVVKECDEGSDDKGENEDVVDEGYESLTSESTIYTEEVDEGWDGDDDGDDNGRDCCCGRDLENDVEHMLVRCRSRCIDYAKRGLDDGL